MLGTTTLWCLGVLIRACVEVPQRGDRPARASNQVCRTTPSACGSRDRPRPEVPALCHSPQPKRVIWIGAQDQPCLGTRKGEERATQSQRRHIGQGFEARRSHQTRCSATTFTEGRLGDLNPGPTHYETKFHPHNYEGNPFVPMVIRLIQTTPGQSSSLELGLAVGLTSNRPDTRFGPWT